MPHPFLVFVKAVVERFKSVALGRRRIGLSFFILTEETNGLLKRGTATTFTESKGETALIHVSHPSVMRQKEGVSDHGGSFMYSVHTLLVFPSAAAAPRPGLAFLLLPPPSRTFCVLCFYMLPTTKFLLHV